MTKLAKRGQLVKLKKYIYEVCKYFTTFLKTFMESYQSYIYNPSKGQTGRQTDKEKEISLRPFPFQRAMIKVMDQ